MSATLAHWRPSYGDPDILTTWHWLTVDLWRCYHDLRRLLGEPDISNHMEAAASGPCWHCSEPTRWIELSFEAYLCPGACTDANWDEYFAACDLAGNIVKVVPAVTE